MRERQRSEVEGRSVMGVSFRVFLSGREDLRILKENSPTHLRIPSLSDPRSLERLTSNLGAARSGPPMPGSPESPPLRAPVWADPCTCPWPRLRHRGYLWGHKRDNSDL